MAAPRRTDRPVPTPSGVTLEARTPTVPRRVGGGRESVERPDVFGQPTPRHAPTAPEDDDGLGQTCAEAPQSQEPWSRERLRVLEDLRDRLQQSLLRHLLPQPCRQPHPLLLVLLHLRPPPPEDPVAVPVQLLQLPLLPVGCRAFVVVVVVVVRAVEGEARGGVRRVRVRAAGVEVVLLVHRVRLLVVAALLRVVPAHLLLLPRGVGVPEAGRPQRPWREDVQALVVLAVAVRVSVLGPAPRAVEPVCARRGRPARVAHVVTVHRQVRVLTVRLL